MNWKLLLILLIFTTFSCNNHTDGKNYPQPRQITKANDSSKISVINQIPVPKGFNRKEYDKKSFSTWLQNVSLKNDNTVYLYNGEKKKNQSAQYAVLDISVGTKDLQQCADAVMRLKAEYLFNEKKYKDILFFDNDGTKYQFSTPYIRGNFDNYLQRVFGMCGSASLSKQLHTKQNFNKIEAGDVIIRGGFPGHAVIVMDVAVNLKGEKVYLLAQSYMPAQDIHLLVNPNNAELSPWYEANEDEGIITPEYTFTKNELKTW